jgi:hypothetical protein
MHALASDTKMIGECEGKDYEDRMIESLNQDSAAYEKETMRKRVD